MANNDKPANGQDPKFSFGVRELREATRANTLALEEKPRNSKNEGCGFDPYNTSGSFDRKKHWERVSKR